MQRDPDPTDSLEELFREPTPPDGPPRPDEPPAPDDPPR
jgi:hypothetical protein